MEVICIESEAFYQLIDEVVERIRGNEGIKDDLWVDSEEAMKIIKISSKTTLQKLRDEGKIRFSKTGPKHILYFRQSLMDYLEQHAKETF